MLSAAAQGVRGSGDALPFLDTIQRCFGHHDVSAVQAFVGGQAKTASEAIGAEAYASGNAIAFRSSPTLHTAAHEAAHIVQQRAGVQLSGGVGQAGDKYEVHADAVADLVVQGKTATGLLDQFTGQSPVEQQQAVQMRPEKNAYPSAGRGTHPMPGTEPVRLRRRLLGVFKFQGRIIEIGLRVRARTPDGWKTFLENLAGHADGSIELVAFMARALGHGRFPIKQKNSLAGLTPVRAEEAHALMEAFLTVGGAIDLADKSHEQPDDEQATRKAIVANTGPIMAAFNSRFSASALTQMTQRRGPLPEEFATTVGDYAEDAADMKRHADKVHGRATACPVNRLIASALGTAVGAVQKVADARTQAEKRSAYDLVDNSAMAIKGCLDDSEADMATTKAVLVMLFKAAAGAVAAVTAGTGAMALGLFLPGAEEFLGACLQGSAADARNRLINDFVRSVHELEKLGRLDADPGRMLKLTFRTRLK